MSVLHARGLTKEFRQYQSRPGISGALRDLWQREYTTLRAVDNLDLTLEEGQVVGYIGANGAGKSTSIKMFTGILEPSGGELIVNGAVPSRDRERFVGTIGVVFGQRSQLWWDIAVQESFALLQQLYRVPAEQMRTYFGTIIEVLDLGPLLTTPVRKLSLGQRMRCEMAAALLHRPQLLFLDEPTIGLDISVKLRLREFLRAVNQQYGTTILLTTHDLSDIEALCRRVVLLDKGRVVYDGTLSDLKENWAGNREVQVTFVDPVSVETVAAATAGLPVTGLRTASDVEVGLTLTNPDYPLATLLAALPGTVRDVRVAETSMEQIVRALYESSGKAGALTGGGGW